MDSDAACGRPLEVVAAGGVIPKRKIETVNAAIVRHRAFRIVVYISFLDVSAWYSVCAE